MARDAAAARTLLGDVPIQIVSRIARIDAALRTRGPRLSPGGWARLVKLTPSQLDAEYQRVAARLRAEDVEASAEVLGRRTAAE